LLVRPAPLKRQYDVGTPVTARPSVLIFPLRPHLHIELEVKFLSIRAYGIVDLKLLIVFFVQLELAARTSLSLNCGGELARSSSVTWRSASAGNTATASDTIDMINRMNKFRRLTPAG
jgi:hypothetical protein